VNRRRWWIVGALVVAIASSVGVLWWALPGLVHWAVVRQIESLTGRRTTIEQLDLDLARGHLAIAGLRLAARAPGPPVAELDRLDVRFEPGSLLRGHLWIREATFGGARVQIVRSERGDLNISDLLARPVARGGSAAVTVDRFALTGGVVSLEDRTRAPAHTWRVEGIAIEASGLSTTRVDTEGTGRLTATVGGAPISAELSELRLVPLRARVRVGLKNVDATLAALSFPADMPVALQRVVLTADLVAILDAGRGVRLDGQGRLDDLTLQRRGTGTPLAAAPSLAFTLSGVQIDAAGGRSRFGRIEMTGTATLFGARTSSASRFEMDRLQLRIEEVEGPGPRAQVTITAGFSGGGRLDVQGPARLAPLGAELRTRVTRLDPSVLMSYLPLPVDISGVVESDLTVDLAYSGALTARIRGSTTINRVTAADGGHSLATAQQIVVTGIDASWPRIGVAQIRVVQPNAMVERDRVGRAPLASLFAAGGTAPGSESGSRASSRSPAGVTVEIGEIAVEEGTVTLDDASVVPPVRLALSPVRFTARDITWPARRPSTVHLEAATPGTGALDATGTLSLDPVRLDVRARLAGAALAPYQGYVPFPARIQGYLKADLAITGSLGPHVEVGARGTVALSDVTVADADRRSLRVARVETTGLEYAWPATLKVDRLHVQRSLVRVERPGVAATPLDTPQRSSIPRESARTVPAALTGMTVAVREAVLDDGEARIVDRAVSPAARFDVTGVSLVARDFTWPGRSPTAVELRAVMPGGGTVSARGELNVAFSSVNLNLTISDLDLTPAQPYLPVRGRIAGKAGGELEVKATLDPLAITARGAASVDTVSITENERPLLTVARIETSGVDYAWPAKVAIDRLHVQKSWAAIERRPDGTFPLALVFNTARATPAATARSAPASTGASLASALDVSVQESVLEGAVTVVDGAATPAARFEVAGVRLMARDFSWPPRGPTAVHLQAPMPGGGSLSARGQLALAPAKLDLDVVLNDVDVAPAQPYLPLRGRIAGKASGNLQVNATVEPLAITARGTASLNNLAMAERERPLLTAERIETTGFDYTWPATVKIDRLRVQKPWALVERQVDGVLSLQGVLPAARPEGGGVRSAVPAASGAPAGLRINVRRSMVENGAATIVDGRVSPAARFEITGARLTVRELAWPTRGASGFVLRASTPGGGILEARGQLAPDASSIDAKLVLDRVDLALAQPFMPVRGRIAGKVTAEVQVKGRLAPLALSALGRMTVTDASLGDGQRALVTVKGADVAGLNAEWPRRYVTIERIVLREPWALVERDADGNMPLLSLITPGPARPSGALAGAGGPGTPRPAADAAGGQVGPADDAPVVQVGALIVEEGFIRFSDRTTTQAFVEEVSRLAVTARTLGTASTTRSQLTATGRLTGGVPIELRGEVGPLGGPLFLDIEGKVAGLALPRINPYANRLLGWVARRGAFDVTFHYRVRDDRLEASNEIVIGQPVFVPSRGGDEVRKRVGVPLDLLVSLLKNARGEISLSVPITGTVSSRQFDFGDAVWDAVRKAAISVLALPVSWVGKIFYTADSRIDTIAIWPVYFDPGTTRMQRGVDAHAERVATFLRQAPAIMLTLKPVMTVDDVSVLKRDAARQRIEALARESGQADAKAAAARLFAERFPGRPVPAELEAMVEELAKEEPTPDSVLKALAARRVEVTRRELEAKGGVDPARLRTSEGALPVEASGPGRVEFEIAPAAEAAS
jgi:Domain of Unknown Function (DUF748)